MDNEIWLAIVGHEGFYEVSNLGRVRTAGRRMTKGFLTFLSKNKIMAQYSGGRCKNYRRVMLSNPTRIHAYVHTLVCRAFHGKKPSSDYVVCHRDDEGTNNRADNLYWGTPADNRADFERNHVGTGKHRLVVPLVDPCGYVADEFAGGF